MPRKKPAKTVLPVHFEDFDGFMFERLVFAYHARTDKWRSLEWYGQAGSDLGRDIWGVRDDGTTQGETVCIQCVNRKSLTFAKASADMAKVLKAPMGMPKRFRIVARANVSAEMRDKIKKHAAAQGVTDCDVWSGTEFEEFLRHKAETLLKRFIEGEEFPDAAADLIVFATDSDALSDQDTLALMEKFFDRPAFYTPIHQESNLLDFRQAINDTIQSIGTGILKARDGNTIARIPSRQQLKDEQLRDKLQDVEKALAKLRAKFDDLCKTGIVRHCQCNNPQCPTYFMPPDAAGELDSLRLAALRKFQDAYPAFRVPTGW